MSASDAQRRDVTPRWAAGWMLAILLVQASCGDESPEAADGPHGSHGRQAQALVTPTAGPLLATETLASGLAAGVTRGAADVTPDGASEYSIDLWVPPGRNGMQPSIALKYSSTQGNGTVGQSWALTAYSSILRCDRMRFLGGESAAVSYTAADAFCLDGQRLILVDAPSGATWASYRLERNPRVRIRMHLGSVAGRPTPEPLGFTVEHPDGRVLTYGLFSGASGPEGLLRGKRWLSQPNGSVALAPVPDTYGWYLTRVQDRYANTLEYLYTTEGEQDGEASELYLSAIVYNDPVRATAGAVPNVPRRQVTFEYEARPDVRTRFVSGLQLRTARRLKSIRAMGPGGAGREYRLAYGVEGRTDGSLLASLQECDAAQVCLAPTRFEYSQHAGGFEPFAGVLPSDVSLARAQLADINGDGRDDLIYPQGGIADERWLYRVSTGDGFAPPQDTGLGVGVVTSLVLTDLDGDGRTDVVQVTPGADYLTAKYKYFTHTGASSGALFRQLSDYAADGRPREAFPSNGPPWLVDFQGDGRPEVLRPYYDPNGRFWTLLLRDNWSGMPEPYNVNFWPSTDAAMRPVLQGSGNVMPTRLDSTQRMGLLVRLQGEVANRMHLLKVAPNGVATLTPTNIGYGRPYLQGDFNGDGVSDAAVFEGSQDPWLSQYWGIKDNFYRPASTVVPQALAPENHNQGATTFDYDSDGMRDILVFSSSLGTRSALQVLRSTGLGFAPRGLFNEDTGQPLPLPDADTLTRVLDINGDGLDDILQVVGGVPTLYVRTGWKQGLLVRVVDGSGARVEFDYAPMLSQVHQPATSGCQYPISCTRRGMWLVSAMREESGVAPLRHTSFTYEGARTDNLGRGFLGFARRTVRTGETGSVTTYEYDNLTPGSSGWPSYPFTRMPKRQHSTVTLENGRVREREILSEYIDRPSPLYLESGIHDVVTTRRTTREWERLSTEAPGTGLLTHVVEAFTPNAHGDITLHTTTYPLTGDTDEVSTTYFYAPADHGSSGVWLRSLPQDVVTRSTTATPAQSLTRTVRNEYDTATGALKSVTVEPGTPALTRTTTHSYATDGLLSSVAESAGGETRTTAYGYDATDRQQPTSITNALGHVTGMAYQRDFGLVAMTVGPNGESREHRYDGLGRERSMKEPGRTPRETSYGADAASPLILRHTQAGEPAVTRRFDRLGREVGTERVAFDGSLLQWGRVYDVLGRVVESWDPSPADSRRATTRTQYDKLGRMTRVTKPDGAVLQWRYEGRASVAVDEKGRETRTEVDARGRPARTVQRVGTRDVATTLTYGAFGHPVETRDSAGNRVIAGFDAWGRRTSLSDPDAGLSATTYTAFGEVKTERNAAGQERVYTYDALGRVKTLAHTGLPAASFVYDQGTGALGQLSSSTSGDGVITRLVYDSLGRLVSTQYTLPGEAQVFHIDQTYDATYGRLTSTVYPQVGSQARLGVEYRYSAQGFLVDAVDPVSKAAYWQATRRAANGAVLDETFGNGAITRRAVDHLGQTTFVSTVRRAAGATTDTPLQQWAYEYDVTGALKARHERVTKTSEDFEYDDLDRLKTWTAWQNCKRSVVSFGYDDLGNLTQRTQVQGPGTSLTLAYAGPRPHAVTAVNGAAYGYDAAGRQTSGPGRTVTYSAADLPRTLTASGLTATFLYDATGARVRKSLSNGDQVVSLGGLYERRRSGTALQHAFSIVAGGRPVASVRWVESGGSILSRSTLYLHPDRFGTVTATSAADGSVQRAAFEPFGASRNPSDIAGGGSQASGAGLPQFGFTGHEHDAELGLINMKGRIYDASIARFLSPDPVLRPGLQQSYNRYSYVRNNPLRYVDPTGYCEQDPDAMTGTPCTPPQTSSQPEEQVVCKRWSIDPACPGPEEWDMGFDGRVTTTRTYSLLQPRPAASLGSDFDCDIVKSCYGPGAGSGPSPRTPDYYKFSVSIPYVSVGFFSGGGTFSLTLDDHLNLYGGYDDGLTGGLSVKSLTGLGLSLSAGWFDTDDPDQKALRTAIPGESRGGGGSFSGVTGSAQKSLPDGPVAIEVGISTDIGISVSYTEGKAVLLMPSEGWKYFTGDYAPPGMYVPPVSGTLPYGAH